MQRVGLPLLALILGAVVTVWLVARHRIVQDALRPLPGIVPPPAPAMDVLAPPRLPHCILAIQSGGTHVLATLRYLQRIHAVKPHLFRSVTCYAGTSMGSVVATLLALGYTPTQILSLVVEEAPHTLQRSVLWRLLTLDGVYRSRFNTRRMQRWLSVVYGDVRLRDLRQLVLVPATMDDGEIVTYHNFPGSPHGDMMVREIVMASCAAPVMLPPHKRRLDGALFAPSPGLHALLLLLQSYPSLSLQQVCMLCLGTHSPLSVRMPAQPGFWWYLRHAGYAVNIAIQSNRRSIHRHLLALLGDRCCIVDLPIPAELSSAWDGSLATQLVNVGSQYPLVLPWLDRHLTPDR